MKLSEEQRLQRAHLQIINHDKYCAMGAVIMYGETRIDEQVPTACTNGYTTRYGRKFMSAQNEPEFRFVILHENDHKARRHMLVWRHLYDKNHKLANRACDYVINLKLTDMDAGEGFIKMPKGGMLDERFRGMDEGQVFRILEQEDEGGDDGFDEHDWESADDLSEEERDKIAKDIDEAIRQGAIIAGKRGAQVDRGLLGLLEPKVNWREVLRDFVMTQCAGRDMSTWRKVNRKFVGSGIYMPGHISESVGRLAVCVDTSGSIGMKELGEFMSEVVGVAKQVSPEVLDLIYWDAEVAAHEKYGSHELEGLEHKTKPKGGGGTAPSCITSYMRKHNIKPECAIVLTDGYVGNDWGGQWPCPVLWVVVGSNITAAVGKTVHIK